MTQDKIKAIDLNEILSEDERQIFEEGVNNVRRGGFGEVTLCFRNGYVYRVKTTIGSFNKNGDKQK